MPDRAVPLEQVDILSWTQASTLVAELATALRACAEWHHTSEIVVGSSDPPWLADALTLASQETHG